MKLLKFCEFFKKVALFCYCPPPRPFAPLSYTCYSILVAFQTLSYTIKYKRHLQFNYAAKFLN